MKVKVILLRKTEKNKDVVIAMRSFADDSFPEAEIYYNSVKEIESIGEGVSITMLECDLEIKTK